MTNESLNLADMCSLDPAEVEKLFYNLSESEENVTLKDFLGSHSHMCDQLFFEKTISIVVPIVFTIIVLVGIIGNILVLIVVLIKQQMRNTTNVLITVIIFSLI